MQDIARLIEQADKDNNLEKAQALMPNFKKEFAVLLDKLAEEFEV